jgi:hypothetical protein
MYTSRLLRAHKKNAAIEPMKKIITHSKQQGREQFMMVVEFYQTYN